MATRLVIVPFWKNYDRKAVLRAAQLAEDLGYDSIWIPEASGANAHIPTRSAKMQKER